MIQYELPSDKETELRAIGYCLTMESSLSELSDDLFFHRDSINALKATRMGELPQFDDVAVRYEVSGYARRFIEEGVDLYITQFLEALKRLRSLSKRREMIRDAEKAIVMAMDQSVEVLVASNTDVMSVDEMLQAVEEEAMLRATTGGIRFGYDIIDRITGGCSLGQLITIIATNGTFKTTLLQNMISNALSINEDLQAMFFSFEMSADDEGRREVLSYAKQGSLKALGYEIYNAPDRWQETKRRISGSHLSRLHRVYKPMNLDQIETCIKVKKKDNPSLRLIGIDYLDFIATPGLSGVQRVDRIANGLKELSKRVGVVTILLTQVDKSASRTQYDPGGKAVQRPLNRFDALGGNSISNASDLCICMWKEGDVVAGKIDKHRSPHDPTLINPAFILQTDAKNFTINDLDYVNEDGFDVE